MCRPGDGALPKQYAPVGTQVGTPAWIPDPPKTETNVAQNWFVIIKGESIKKAARKNVKLDTAGTNLSPQAKSESEPSSRSLQSIISAASAGECIAASFALQCHFNFFFVLQPAANSTANRAGRASVT